MNSNQHITFILTRPNTKMSNITELNATIKKKYPSLNKSPDGKLDFTFMEYDNAFVNVLCNKYLQGSYTPINFGLRGCGNRATIKELYFYPEIDWHLIDEIIVIYCPSGVERFDFINDTYTDHFSLEIYVASLGE